MFRRIKLWYWKRRLQHANDFAHNLEGTIARERHRAKQDVGHCEVMVARANVALIERNANRRLAAMGHVQRASMFADMGKLP